MRHIRAVLFDLDDTLIDRRAAFTGYARLFYRDFRDRLQLSSVSTVERQLVHADQGGYSHGRRPHTLISALVWNQIPTADELEAHWREHFPGCTVARPGMVETLSAVRALGLRTGLVTNGFVSDQMAKLDLLPARDLLDTVIVSEGVGVDKPDARIFQLALQQLQVSSDEAWFVGDHPLNDMVGAARAGLEPVWLRGAHAWPPAEPAPAHQIDALPELIALLENALQDPEPQIAER